MHQFYIPILETHKVPLWALYYMYMLLHKQLTVIFIHDSSIVYMMRLTENNLGYTQV